VVRLCEVKGRNIYNRERVKVTLNHKSQKDDKSVSNNSILVVKTALWLVYVYSRL